MPRRAKQRGRGKLAGPALTIAVVVFSIASLGALHLWAGGPGSARISGDALALALLRADVDRRPQDSQRRLRLIREQLALGLFGDAERTLGPLVGAESASAREAALLSLDIAVGSWRATAPALPERRSAQRRALERLEAFLPREATLDGLAHAAQVARELGRPDLAARAQERAAALEPDPQRAIDLGLAAVDAYRAADSGGEALRLVEKLADRFPAERAVLERAGAIALAQNDPARARRFGEQLMAIGALDTVSLGRQLDLDLAAADLGGALKTAERLAKLAPADAQSRLTAARVAIWAGRPDRALHHWTWLARRGDAQGVEQALQLARAMRDEAAVAELLTLRSGRELLSEAALAELAHALESTAAPRSATSALERYAATHPANALAWQGLAAAQERRREFAAALATRLEVARRFGRSLLNSVAVAKLQWAVGNAGGALAELQGWIDSAGPGQVEYWDALAEIAWHEEADAVALRAYRALWENRRIDAAGAERLLLLNRAAGRTDDLIRFGREGWSRLRQPRLLLLAMDQAAQAGRWSDVELMADEAATSGAFENLPAFWLLRARLEERAGRIPEAIGAYRRALASDPKSVAARSGLLWLLAGAHEREPLSEYLAAWADDAPADPALSRAYLAGLQELSTPQPGASRSLAATVGTEVTAESIGSAVLAQQRAFVRSEIPGGELEIREGLVAFLSNDANLRVPGAETRLSARGLFPGLGGHTEISTGIGLRPDRNVLQAGLARTQIFPSLGELRLEASLKEPADESLALRSEAVRNRVGGAIAVSEGHAYQRVAYDWKIWSTRAGEGLGSGGSANIEIGWRTQSPDLIVRLQGGYQRNSLRRGPLPTVLRAFDVDRSVILPAELAAVGLGIGAARLPIGPARLAADAWLGWVGPPARAAFRVQTGLALTPFRNGELALSAFAANDRWAAGGNVGVNLSLTHRFGL
jgi:tetratricopeptide (TPR) repeat protein